MTGLASYMYSLCGCSQLVLKLRAHARLAVDDQSASDNKNKEGVTHRGMYCTRGWQEPLTCEHSHFPRKTSFFFTVQHPHLKQKSVIVLVCVWWRERSGFLHPLLQNWVLFIVLGTFCADQSNIKQCKQPRVTVFQGTLPSFDFQKVPTRLKPHTWASSVCGWGRELVPYPLLSLVLRTF